MYVRVTYAVNREEIVTQIVEAPGLLEAIDQVLLDAVDDEGNYISEQLLGVSALLQEDKDVQ